MPPKTHKALHSATWWRGPVTVVVKEEVEVFGDGEVQGTVKRHWFSPLEDQLVPYNPFDFYHPALRTKDRRAISLYHRFMSVDPLNLKDVQRFCEEFGVLGDPKKTWERWNATGTLDAIFPYDGASDDPLSNIMATKKRTPPHHSLCASMTLHEFQLEQSAMKSAFQSIQDISQKKTPRKTKQEAWKSLESRLAGELTKVGQRPVWNQKKRTWASHWDSLSLVAIMYQMLFFDLLGTGKNVRCEKCGNPFLAEHPRTQYCSERCRNTSKKARQRKKKQKGKGYSSQETVKSRDR